MCLFVNREINVRASELLDVNYPSLWRQTIQWMGPCMETSAFIMSLLSFIQGFPLICQPSVYVLGLPSHFNGRVFEIPKFNRTLRTFIHFLEIQSKSRYPSYMDQRFEFYFSCLPLTIQSLFSNLLAWIVSCFHTHLNTDCVIGLLSTALAINA